MINFNFIENEIHDQYLIDDDNRPWIIGFSGGKDSTLLLQLVWRALLKIPAEIRHQRPIHIVCNDTLVENPRIVKFIEDTLSRIEEAANLQSLPFQVVKTKPRLEDSFWVNMVGKGYPAPTSSFRWCTERLKINPTTKFILEKISEKGEAIILLGTRRDESASRSRSLNKHERKNQRLRKHVLPNAFVYAPIVDIEINELWQYLMQVPPPWGGTHKELVTLYRNANSGDCPLVIDDTTPSCGQSRFGCWVCTVVKKDKSMEGLIENGEEWMEPLSDLRDFFVETRENGEIYREKFGRNGSKRAEGKYGPYKPTTRAEFLKRILTAQREISKVEPVDLISHQEMILIQFHWFRDGLFFPKVSDIYNEIFQSDVTMSRHAEKHKEELEMLQKVCSENPEDVQLIQELLALQKTKSLMLRKRGMQADIEQRLDKFLNPDKAGY